MSFALLHKLVAYLLSGLGLLALSLGSELEPTALALVFAAYAGSFFAEGKLIERKYYGVGWTVSVVLFLCVQVARAVAIEPTLAMAIEFAAYLQISRLWNRRMAVDYQQIAVLSFLHLIAATVLSASLSYALIFVGFVIATPWMLALSQLRREIEGNYPAAAPNDERAQAAVRRVLASKRVVGAQFLVSTALLAVPLFAMTLTIFVIVPRVGQGFLSLNRSEGQRVAGFGNQVELGGFGVIRDDPTVVLRVTPLPRTDPPVQLIPLRLRGTSFDHYDGFRWSRTRSRSLPMATLGRDHYPLRREGDPRRDQVLQIVLDHLDEPVVFLPQGTVALSVPPRVMHGEARSRELTRAAGLDLRYADPDELGLIYTAFVTKQSAEADLAPIATERKRSYLQVPPGHERIAELAKQLTVGARSQDESARMLLRYLHSGVLSYSLDQPDVKGKLPLLAFMFDAKRGHCEYFASAMAIMLRTLGIPSRNVTGFAGGRFNPFGGYYALRQGDAHSWVEAYIEGRGWVTYDATPPSRESLGPRQNLWADMQALADALRTRWMTSVVGYDLRTQVGILRKLATLFAQSSKSAGIDGNDVRDGARSLKGFVRSGLIGLGVIAVVIGFLVWRARRKQKASTARKVSAEAEQVVKLYHELERALAARGYARPPASTPKEHVRSLQARGFPYADEVREVTERYMQVRYGAAGLDKAEVARLKAAIAKVKSAGV